MVRVADQVIERVPVLQEDSVFLSMLAADRIGANPPQAESREMGDRIDNASPWAIRPDQILQGRQPPNEAGLMGSLPTSSDSLARPNDVPTAPRGPRSATL